MFSLRLTVVVVLFFCFVNQVAANDEISIKNEKFFKGDSLWIAEGVTLVGRVSPAEVAKNKKFYAKAREKYGDELLNSIGDYGADLVRFQVSQGGLDPQSPIYEREYVDEIIESIKQTRDAGFNVIISMQWQGPSGSRDEGGLPTYTTRRAWQQIVDDFSDDRGVLLEVFNEPKLHKASPKNWRIWKKSMQGLIDYLREKGAQNVLLVDGLKSAHVLEGAPELDDPLGQTAYAVHPYLDKINQTQKQWDKNFGNFADTHPVMATEFMAYANRGCRNSLPNDTKELLEYLKGKDIGLVLWAFDVGNIKKGSKYTTFDNLSCKKGERKGGAGQMIHEYFTGK
ncbi:glycoside hydrolase family 5 protein [Salinicola corii]|uniref:Glycoside hydrolase family 5 protein n=1 Tax=Salinicola corii TaxID=2606937 RepID=A0A640WFQ4_9GAMM|nr:cellulase family glycosylhydrolase [Salinicola corii]KAA0019016.1 glycoside hydrolase family 5 protein [Salinicola corii]